MIYGVVLAGVVICLGVLTQLETDTDLLLVDKSAALTKSRAKIFQFLSDMRNLPLFMPGVVSFEPSDSEPMGLGKHFVETQKIPIIGDLHYDNRISGYESPRFIGYISNNWMHLRTELVAERSDRPDYPCQINIKVYTRRRSYLMQYILGPVLSHIETNKMRQALFNLKYVLQR